MAAGGELFVPAGFPGERACEAFGVVPWAAVVIEATRDFEPIVPAAKAKPPDSPLPGQNAPGVEFTAAVFDFNRTGANARHSHPTILWIEIKREKNVARKQEDARIGCVFDRSNLAIFGNHRQEFVELASDVFTGLAVNVEPEHLKELQADALRHT